MGARAARLTVPGPASEDGCWQTSGPGAGCLRRWAQGPASNPGPSEPGVSLVPSAVRGGVQAILGKVLPAGNPEAGPHTRSGPVPFPS